MKNLRPDEEREGHGLLRVVCFVMEIQGESIPPNDGVAHIRTLVRLSPIPAYISSLSKRFPCIYILKLQGPRALSHSWIHQTQMGFAISHKKPRHTQHFLNLVTLLEIIKVVRDVPHRGLGSFLLLAASTLAFCSFPKPVLPVVWPFTLNSLASLINGRPSWNFPSSKLGGAQ